MQIICMDGECLKNYREMVLNGWNSYERFIKNYDNNINEGYTLEVDVKYPKKLIQSS